ncbi:Aldo/keto reductase [Rhizopogon vinicolor AM-OR11-026]|uniref:Aldo/keto reductase n=1 Tax=Rhizopogon vinicolor AM-OR11-026 TaxID=1314800 RepID=A0A1B7NCX1_9AGAM|nr:Aldo/keto reductase [Rhizopogon vinicolor AM-OR11-026]
MSTRIPLLFGTMTMGFDGTNGVRTSRENDCQELLDTFFSHGHTELDTARVYTEGTAEQVLAKLDVKNATIDTKVWPVNPGDHSPEKLRSIFLTSLQYLKHNVRVLYLHAPDRSVPFEDTVREINNLYKEGLFEIFGLSNFAAWEVAEVVGICKANGYVLPKIYQVMYNAITREMETELLPCCRKYGIRLVAYNLLVGGLFSGKVLSMQEVAPKGRHFDPKSKMRQSYRAWYFKEGYFKALKVAKTAADKHGLRLTEVALRWCQHHSLLIPEDGIILGASSAAQLEQNCVDSEKGPLPQDVVDALDEACRIVKAHGDAPLYWRP